MWNDPGFADGARVKRSAMRARRSRIALRLIRTTTFPGAIVAAPRQQIFSAGTAIFYGNAR